MTSTIYLKTIILILFVAVNVYGQGQSSSTVSVSAAYARGYIYPHHESFNYFIKDYTSAFELNFEKEVSGEKNWHQIYRKPTVGAGYYFVNLGNPEQLGNAHAIFPYISIPVLKTRYFNISYKCAAGVAWLSKSFDLYKNKYNIAIGSNLNAYLNLNLNFDLRFTEKFSVKTGVGLTHFSNGGTQHPNRGFNIFALQAGIKYDLSRSVDNIQIDTLPKFKKKNEFTIIYAGGLKTLEPAGKKKYFVSTVSFNAERQISHKSRIGAGLDLFKDNSRKEYLLSEDINEPEGKDLYYAGGHLSYDLVFGKTSFTIQMGGYLWQRSKSYEEVYHRFGLKYRFSKRLMANLTLKTFWAAADFAEFGLGYRFY